MSNRCVAGDGADVGADATDASEATDAGGERDGSDVRQDADVQPLPCEGGCGDQVCDVEQDQCVDCVLTEDCQSGVCDPAHNICVECVMSEHCQVGVCDPDTNTCVSCVSDSDCTTPNASACNTATHTCVSCSDSSQCGHIADAKVCDVDAESCVECLDDDPTTRAACGGNSCDPMTSTCTLTPVTSLASCDFCMADSECPTDYRCVPMQFMGSPRNNGVGGYCLRKVNSSSGEGCPLPYQVGITRKSINGAAAEPYCGILESTTTCEAVRDLLMNKDCNNESECGAVGLQDGRCELILGNLKCTYTCTDPAECTTVKTCGQTSNYCGGT